MKHTLGTWTYVPDLNAVVIIQDHKVKLVADFGKSDLPETKVNAQLASAAPDLFNALQMLREVAALVPDKVWAKASDDYNDQFNPKNINEYKFTMDISRDAIDKAKRGA